MTSSEFNCLFMLNVISFFYELNGGVEFLGIVLFEFRNKICSSIEVIII